MHRPTSNPGGRYPDRGTIAIAIICITLFVLWIYLVSPIGRSGFDARAEEWCKAGYQRAKTASDSQIVDAQRPVVSRLQATSEPSCEMIRWSGRIR